MSRSREEKQRSLLCAAIDQKIRFLHSYGTNPTTQTTRIHHSVGNSSSQQQQQQQHQHYSPSTPSPSYPGNVDSNDPTVIKYSQVYEAQLNPFNQFSRYEKQRVYKKLQPYEKLMLHLVRCSCFVFPFLLLLFFCYSFLNYYYYYYMFLGGSLLLSVLVQTNG
ncbi:unnamed protein product [Trichobilharzia regenti]|nr:unnamed protein product [Trichobilharzia regenti]